MLPDRHPQYPYLFSPLTLGSVTLRNRVGISGHFAGWWAEEGLPTESFAAYVEERAKGGVGLFVVGATAVRYDGGPTWLLNLDERIVPRYRLLVEAAHRREHHVRPDHLELPRAGGRQPRTGQRGKRPPVRQ